MSYQANLVRFIKYFRTSYGLSQEDFGQIIGANRLKAHRIEHFKSEMNFEEWFRFSEHFKVTPDDVRLGYLNFEEREGIKEAFSVPPRLRQNAFSGGRELSIHKWNFERLFGEKAFGDFCKTQKLNPLYLTNLGATLNMDFVMRLVESVMMSGELRTPEAMKTFTKLIFQQGFHQTSGMKEMWKKNGVDRITDFVTNHIQQYEKNHNYGIEATGLKGSQRFVDFSYGPLAHVNRSLYDRPDISTFFKQMIPNMMVSLTGQECVLETKAHGPGKNVYRISEPRC